VLKQGKIFWFKSDVVTPVSDYHSSVLLAAMILLPRQQGLHISRSQFYLAIVPCEALSLHDAASSVMLQQQRQHR
jgi:hypothetical protein